MYRAKLRFFMVLMISIVMVFTMAAPAWADGDPAPSDGPSVTDPIDPADTDDPADPNDPSDQTDQTDTTESTTTQPTTTAPTKPKIKTGWQTIKGHKYYYDSKGHPLTGIHKINGKVYSFTSSGELNTGDSGKMDVKAFTKSSKTKYLILVNCKTHRVGVYKGRKDKWVRLYYWKCGDGKKSTPTVKGTFKTGSYLGRAYKQKYFDAHGARCWYATRIYGAYLFHSVLYKPASKPKKIKDGRLGKGVSHGCVRLKLKNAKWIYKNIPKKTKVIIYK